MRQLGRQQAFPLPCILGLPGLDVPWDEQRSLLSRSEIHFSSPSIVEIAAIDHLHHDLELPALFARRIQINAVRPKNDAPFRHAVMIELTVPSEHAGMRLDRYLAVALPQFSRSRLQALIRAGEVVLQGMSVRTRKTVRAGDVVRLIIPPLREIDAQAEEIPLEILFEDDDLLVLNKPPGLVVHPGAGNQTHTLVNALLHHCTKPLRDRRKTASRHCSSSRQGDERLSRRREK